MDLSDDVKNDIRNEVSMMLNRQQEQKKVKKSRIGKKRGSEAERPMKKQKVEVAASGIRGKGIINYKLLNCFFKNIPLYLGSF